jgi:hypothetical protein
MLVAAACASGGPDDATETGPGSSSVTSPTPQDPSPTDRGGAGGSGRPVAEVLRFSAPRLGGGTIEGVDFAGKDVAFWFWAPW